METINLMSDTVTRPTPAMLDYMMKAQVGDDVFGEDPTVAALEKYAADLFGMEAAIFCPSGTMTNQIAINLHTQKLGEVICDVNSHIFQYETGGYAFNARAGITTIHGTNGKITAEEIEAHIRPDFDWFARTDLVVLENTCNRGGGSYYTLEEIQPIRDLCTAQKIALHLDGARLFNALAETQENPRDYGAMFDSISICLSKGLGAPVGSLLLGKHQDIKTARRFRKVMGGGMRQAGYLAAAGLYALKYNRERLKIDNDRSKEIASILASKSWIEHIKPVYTNILIFDVKKPLNSETLAKAFADQNIKVAPFGNQTMRFVFHLDINEQMYERLQTYLRELDF